MKLTLAQIAEAVNGRIIDPSASDAAIPLNSQEGNKAETVSRDANNDPASIMATSVTWDSRDVIPGSLFAALPGERVDGHHFVSDARSKGAVAALVSYEVSASCPQILVDDTAQAFSRLAAFWRTQLKGTVIAITGSTGKTTTKDLIREILALAGSVVATKSNQNNELGVPLTILNAQIDTDYVVVEMGMRGLGQIAELCEIAQPHWGVITNIGQSHCELLGSRENIARAKAELFQALPPEGKAFVNAENDYAESVMVFGELGSRGVSIVSVSTKEESSLSVTVELKVFARSISLDTQGRPSFTLCVQGPSSPVQMASCALQLHGAHNVANACMASAVGIAAGIAHKDCASALARALPQEGRQSFKKTAQGALLIDDAYNASPDSMEASLTTFAALSVNGKRIAVLGDMGELGDLAEEAHHSVGRMAARLGIDTMICAGELARDIAQGAIDAGLPQESVHMFDTATEALEHVKEKVNSGDAVLVKASHFMGFEDIVKGLMQ